MKKDIQFLKVTDIVMAIVPDDSESDLKLYSAYIVNLKDVMLENVFVRSSGAGTIDDEKVKTATLRILIQKIAPKTFVKVDDFDSEAVILSNEYWISFKQDGYLYDKKYVFVPGSIEEQNYTTVPVLGKRGVMIK